ncbi:Formate dehydrogenase-O iron-sulfur subunit [compost metagenome]
MQLWKGWLKPLATIGIAAAGLFGFFHYITVGPNRADDEDDSAANVGRNEEDKA